MLLTFGHQPSQQSTSQGRGFSMRAHRDKRIHGHNLLCRVHGLLPARLLCGPLWACSMQLDHSEVVMSRVAALPARAHKVEAEILFLLLQPDQQARLTLHLLCTLMCSPVL